MRVLIVEADETEKILKRLYSARSVCQAVARLARDNEPEGVTAAVAYEYLTQIVNDFQNILDQADEAGDWTEDDDE